MVQRLVIRRLHEDIRYLNPIQVALEAGLILPDNVPFTANLFTGALRSNIVWPDQALSFVPLLLSNYVRRLQ